MTGPKLNEGATIAGERSGTKATAKYVRSSASKARVVLDLIRGLDVGRADEVLQFTARGVAADVRKVLASAVANAVHNDVQEADELYVVACFADEGPTLRRFRPRARGRATRIRKRTCHITVIVARMSDDRLDVLQARQDRRTAAGRRRAGTSAQSRRDRVERSRQRAQRLAAGEETVDETAEDEEPTLAAEEGAVDVTEVIAEEAEETEDVDVEAAAAAEGSASDEAESSERVSSERDQQQGSASDEAESSERVSSERDQHLGGVEAPDDGSVPEGHEIKGNRNSMKYHVPGGRYYEATIGDVFFDTVEHAEAAGFEAPVTDEAVIEEIVEAEAETEEDE